METTKDEKFDTWAIVEVMGHRRYAGRVTEQTIGGASFVRVDVPELKMNGTTIAGYTKLLGAGSIYAITPVAKSIALEAARQMSERPITMYNPTPLLEERDV